MMSEAPAPDVHSHVTLVVDGEKLADVTARARRSSSARSFQSVPATEGSF